ncbi:hypothetical protein ACSZMY_21155, partial [Aeromonas hydrophila]
MPEAWCEERDSNPHTRGALTPEASASTNSASLNYRHDKASAEALVAEILASHPVRCIAVQADV